MTQLEKQKPLIGIISTLKVFEDENPFNDHYKILNSYCTRIYKEGGIPIGILFEDGHIIKESILKCDGILLPGGAKIHPVLFEVVNLAFKNKIPILGICMGMQALAAYSENISTKNKIIEEGKKRCKYEKN